LVHPAQYISNPHKCNQQKALCRDTGYIRLYLINMQQKYCNKITHGHLYNQAGARKHFQSTTNIPF
jgi:hypothetical protein